VSYKNLRLLVGAALLAYGLGAVAQKSAAEIPVETFFKRAQFFDMKLSPNGERLAALVPHRGRNNLVVIDLKTRTRKIVTGYDSFDVLTFLWINDDRLCMRAGDGQNVTGEPNFRGAGCVDHDGQNFRDFTKVGARTVGMDSVGGSVPINFVAITEGSTPEVFVTMPMRSRDSLDVYRFNTISGRFELVSLDSPGNVRQWVLDRDFVPRVAVSVPERKDNNSGRPAQVWYRDGVDSKWEKLFEFDQTLTGELYQPIAFDFDNATLYIATNHGRDKAAIYRYDTKARKFGDVVAESPLVDVTGGLVFSKAKKKLVGVAYDADKPVVKWFDPDLERLQKLLDNTFAKTYNALLPAYASEARALVYARSDRDPGMYHLLDRTKPTVEPLLQTREWLNPELMSERRFITYKARDGMEIPAWVTIPKGSSGKNLPLIVNIHGGPWVRSYHMTQWGRPEAQFFASRGYVVLDPEPRGSTGFGKKHYVSSFKQWGQTMQDDITDGALHLVKEGIVDKNRMCLHGGSYGGYAAAMGLAKDPDLWKCGTPFVAVTDMFLKASISYSDTAMYTDWYETDARRVIGDPETDKELFTRYSPTLQASRIKAPIFLAMGSNDVRVPVAHGTALKNAVERAGGQIEMVVYNGEGHGFNKHENVVDFYKRLEAFFAKHLK
jgi:dipeptidyl aminopeptidase/acylaminoacyl peptidase